MSRQREWQKQMQAAGRCIICGKKRQRLVFNCDSCATKRNARSRANYALDKEKVAG